MGSSPHDVAPEEASQTTQDEEPKPDETVEAAAAAGVEVEAAMFRTKPRMKTTREMVVPIPQPRPPRLPHPTPPTARQREQEEEEQEEKVAPTPFGTTSSPHCQFDLCCHRHTHNREKGGRMKRSVVIFRETQAWANGAHRERAEGRRTMKTYPCRLAVQPPFEKRESAERGACSTRSLKKPHAQGTACASCDQLALPEWQLSWTRGW